MELETFVNGHMVRSSAQWVGSITVKGIEHVVKMGDVLVYARNDPSHRPDIRDFRGAHEHLVQRIEAGELPTLSGTDFIPR